jgi:UDP-glucose 4-epimerase
MKMNKNAHILITGGTGYIGSHTAVLLLERGYRLTVLDNLSNSSAVVLDRIARLTGKKANFVRGDMRDENVLKTLFNENGFDAVIHFAGLKAVSESVAKPLSYYENNITGTINLLNAMSAADVKTLVFSSSATVYGDPQTLPIPEDAPRSAANPYGRSKLIIEDILSDLHAADPAWRIARLRYFNPVGAHPEGLIGEDPKGIPNNLMPYISQVAGGIRDCLFVFGQDYPTPDGTGIRDYIHVMDLAGGHLAAMDYLESKPDGDLLTVNLGTGRGASVLEMVKAFEQASEKTVPYKIVDRRPGDVAACYADPSLAQSLLDWKAEKGLPEMCADTWRWQSRNPGGYAS